MSGHADVINLVIKNDPENLMLAEGNIIPILTKAVQELSAKVTALEQSLNSAVANISSLQTQVAALQASGASASTPQ